LDTIPVHVFRLAQVTGAMTARHVRLWQRDSREVSDIPEDANILWAIAALLLRRKRRSETLPCLLISGQSKSQPLRFTGKDANMDTVAS